MGLSTVMTLAAIAALVCALGINCASLATHYWTTNSLGEHGGLWKFCPVLEDCADVYEPYEWFVACQITACMAIAFSVAAIITMVIHTVGSKCKTNRFRVVAFVLITLAGFLNFVTVVLFGSKTETASFSFVVTWLDWSWGMRFGSILLENVAAVFVMCTGTRKDTKEALLPTSTTL